MKDWFYWGKVLVTISSNKPDRKKTSNYSFR